METSSNILQQLTSAYTDFKNYAIKIDKWGGTFRDSKADIERQQAELNKKIKTLTNLFDTFASHADNTIRDTVASYRLNISYYLVDDLGGIQNNLYKNLGLSQNLAISVLNRDKKRLDKLPE